MPPIGLSLWILVLALLADAVIGDPAPLWRRIPHPVAIAGRLIGLLDRVFNREYADGPSRRTMGGLALGLVMVSAAATGWGIERIALSIGYGEFLIVIGCMVLIAQRSLYDHVRAVARPLAGGDIPAARHAVGLIVGRDPDRLDEAGIARAAIETLAENFVDGVVAPAFWYALFGLPGLFAYKALNTADSMIGHMSPRYRDFGFAAARLDDLANLLPARLGAVMIALSSPLAGGSAGGAFRVMFADARRHRSPNAGWPEAAMAGGLGIALAGPREYASGRIYDPFLNARGERDLDATDIGRALRVYMGACALHIALYAVIAALL